jgi:hypothetical protein
MTQPDPAAELPAEPYGIRGHQVTEVCRVLGLDPGTVTSISITWDEVVVTHAILRPRGAPHG